MEQMKAVVIAKPGGPEVMKVKQVPKPEVKEGFVCVRVKATAVNRLDLLQRMGLYPVPAGYPEDIPGVEFSGIVEELGKGVKDFKVRDKVFGLVGGGSYAEYVVMPEATMAKMPNDMSFEEAAAIPEAYITAYDAMVSRGKLTSGEIVLISAAASGVGLAAIQIAKAIGATTIGTSRSEYKLKVAIENGLTYAVNTKDGFTAEQAEELIGKDKVNVVLELVGGDYLKEDLCLLARKGRIVLVGLLAGAKTEIDLRTVLRKMVEIHGTVLRSRPIEEKIAVNQVFIQQLIPLFGKGKLKPVIDRIFDLDEVAAAHEYVANNKNCGKVVLVI